MIVRILIADQGEARFQDCIGGTRPVSRAQALLNSSAHYLERELGTDRPGRIFSGHPRVHGQRNAAVRHSAGGESTARRHALDGFVRRIVAELERARAANEFQRLVLVAAPAMLGRLRRALTPALRARLAGSVAKDIVHQPDTDTRRYFERQVFAGSLGFSPLKRQVAVRRWVRNRRAGGAPARRTPAV
jgi:protein required for attachment to host cells